ncbi:hypothetical protein AB0M94_38975 [Streptomyces xanthochromogenes]|uniref:hypothetical protein n=1 Tax=Streptomyces xanthochromogenes TaxID=67384 RepID=UPI0034495AA5
MQETGEERHRLRSATYAVAGQARRLAATLDTEDTLPDWQQPGWGSPRPEPGRPAARYARAALQLLAAAEDAMAAAVAADRAAGDGWASIGTALGTSEDTAARRYRSAAP